jgi:hypothetical protein
MRRAVLLVLLLLPFHARADRRELYALLSASPAVLSLQAPVEGAPSTTAPALGAGLVGYYGLTNTLHVGASLDLLGTRNARFPGVTRVQPDGSPLTGTFFLNAWTVGLSALALYRFDTGYALAPVARVQVGLTRHAFTHQQLIPEGQRFAVDVPGEARLALTAGASLGAEYRWNAHLVASVAVRVGRSFQVRAPWAVELPLAVGWVW